MINNKVDQRLNEGRDKVTRLILDLDDVTCKSVEVVLDLYNEEFGTSLTLEDMKEWNLAKFATSDIYKYYSLEGLHFFRNLPLETGAKEVLTKLHEEGVEIVVASAVKPDNVDGREDKIAWVKENLPMVNEVYITVDKSSIEGDIILDDGVHNLEASSCKHKLVYDRPWNRGDDRFKRVRDWAEVYVRVKEVL